MKSPKDKGEKKIFRVENREFVMRALNSLVLTVAQFKSVPSSKSLSFNIYRLGKCPRRKEKKYLEKGRRTVPHSGFFPVFEKGYVQERGLRTPRAGLGSRSSSRSEGRGPKDFSES